MFSFTSTFRTILVTLAEMRAIMRWIGLIVGGGDTNRLPRYYGYIGRNSTMSDGLLHVQSTVEDRTDEERMTVNREYLRKLGILKLK